jgi:hypothetical protein
MDTATFYVLVTTVPPFVWLLLRFAAIFYERGKQIVYHIKTDGVVAAFHIVVSLSIVVLVPYMIWLNFVPDEPAEANLWVFRDGGPLGNHRVIVRVLSILMFCVNITVMPMLPAPYRYKQYDMSLRDFCRTLAVHYLGGVQFAAMSLQCIFLLDRGWLPTPITLLLGLFVVFIYTFACVVAGFELFAPSFPWEHYLLPSALTEPTTKRKATKSRLMTTAHEILQQSGAGGPMFGSLFVVGTLACVQVICQMYRIYSGAPIWHRFDDFFVTSLLYMSVIQMAGFFSTFSPPLKDGNPIGDLLPKGQRGQLAEVLLTQFIPILLLVAGPYWTNLSGADWRYCFLTWCPAPY